MHVIGHTSLSSDLSTVFTQEQWRALINLIGTQPGSSAYSEKLSSKILSSFWIIDIEASHHVIGNYDLLISHLQNVTLWPVSLPDGK